MNKFEEAMQALDEWSTAKQEYNEALDEFCQSEEYTWDYYGGEYIDKMEEAKNKAKACLDEYVHEMVQEELKKHGISLNK